MSISEHIKRLILLFLLFLSSTLVLWSQSFLYNNLNTDHGLLSSETYDILQDRDGNLWFATEAGISIYDGYGFRSINSEQGLPDNSVLKLFLAPDGKIWFSTFNGRLGIIDNNTDSISFISDSITSLLFGEFVFHIHFADNRTIWLNSNRGKAIKMIDGKVDKCWNQPIAKGQRMLHLRRDKEDFYCYLTVNRDSLYDGNYQIELYNDSLTIRYPFFDGRFRMDYCNEDSTNYYLSFNEKLIFVANNKIVWSRNFEAMHSVIDIFLDEQYLFVSRLANGVDVYDVNNLDEPVFHLLDNQSVSKIFKDSDEAYWFTTLGGGVYSLSSLNFQIISPTFQKKILSFEYFQNTLLFYSYMEGLFLWNESTNERNEPEKWEAPSHSSSIPVYSIQQIGKDTLAIAGTSKCFYNSNLEPIYEGVSRFVVDFYRLVDSRIVLVGGKILRIVDSDLNLIFQSDTLFSKNVRAVCEDFQGRLFLGSIDGLLIHTDSGPINYEESNPLFRSRISSLGKYRNGIAIGTTTTGFLFHSADTTIVISREEGLVSNLIKCILVDSTDIWVGTNKGLSRITFHENSYSSYDIENYTIEFGLPANEIFKIKKKGNHIYAATENGVITFNPHKIDSKYYEPKTLIVRMLSDNLKIGSDSIVVLEHENDNLTLFYKAIALHNNKNLSYMYRLKGYENDWISTENLSVRYGDLPPGAYTFCVKATLDGRIFGPEAKVRIHKKKHLTELLGFRIGIAVIFVLTIAAVMWLIIAYNHRKERIKRNIISAEQKALRLQMNPHFIFNSLGSIQRFVLERNSKIANEYLTDFASLMRLILESSKNSLVPLSDELEACNLYLRLENLRFNDGIVYHVNVSQEIDPSSVKIPPLLIQPLIENSIWHGILLNNKSGRIDINFSRYKEDRILCEITDDGVGYNQGKEVSKKNKKHKSTGLINIRERLSLLSDIYRVRMRMEIIDLGDKELAERSGTTVKLFLYAHNE